MAPRTVDMDPAVAFAEMVTVLAEAGRYAGHGVRTTGKRVGRRARVAGAEAARRGAFATLVLSGRPLVRRPRISLVVAVAAVSGAVVALTVRQSAIVFRARATGESRLEGTTGRAE
jgi:hypothetical protein